MFLSIKFFICGPFSLIMFWIRHCFHLLLQTSSFFTKKNSFLPKKYPWYSSFLLENKLFFFSILKRSFFSEIFWIRHWFDLLFKISSLFPSSKNIPGTPMFLYKNKNSFFTHFPYCFYLLLKISSTFTHRTPFSQKISLVQSFSPLENKLFFFLSSNAPFSQNYSGYTTASIPCSKYRHFFPLF